MAKRTDLSRVLEISHFLSDAPNDFANESQRAAFFRFLKSDQRLGQAFMNVLYDTEYNTLTGSLFDPFYSDDADKVLAAIDFLTR